MLFIAIFKMTLRLSKEGLLIEEDNKKRKTQLDNKRAQKDKCTFFPFSDYPTISYHFDLIYHQ